VHAPYRAADGGGYLSGSMSAKAKSAEKEKSSDSAEKENKASAW
jgi:hypothetical protein